MTPGRPGPREEMAERDLVRVLGPLLAVLNDPGRMNQRQLRKLDALRVAVNGLSARYLQMLATAAPAPSRLECFECGYPQEAGEHEVGCSRDSGAAFTWVRR